MIVIKGHKIFHLHRTGKTGQLVRLKGMAKTAGAFDSRYQKYPPEGALLLIARHILHFINTEHPEVWKQL